MLANSTSENDGVLSFNLIFFCTCAFKIHDFDDYLAPGQSDEKLCSFSPLT